MIILHQYPAAFNLSSLSPFCIKIEFFLKLSNLPYKVKVELNPASGPKGKMPFIQDRGMRIPDSSFIIDHLVKEYGLHHLTIQDPHQKAIAHGFNTMIEEGLYFVLLYSRWVDPDGFEIVKKEFAPLFPPFLGKPFLYLIRRNLTRQGRCQGIGRHSKKEVYEIGEKYLLALENLLGEKDFFFEGKLTSFDASAYAFLSTISKQSIPSPLQEGLKQKKQLCAYLKRVEVFYAS